MKKGDDTMKEMVCGICLLLPMTNYVWAAEASTVTVDVLAKSGESWDGRALPGYANGRPEITILRITIPPEVQLPIHEHPVINAGVLLTGELTVVTRDKKTLHLKAGQALVEVVGNWHYGINEGTEPAEIIVFYAGVEGTPITVKEPVAK